MLSFLNSPTSARDLLRYLFWYYVIARNVTAERTVKAEQLVTEQAPKLLLVLFRRADRIDVPVTFVEGDQPINLAGYRSRAHALWLWRRTLDRLVADDEVEANVEQNLFYGPPEGRFWRHTTEFLRHTDGRRFLEEWRQQDRINLAAQGLLPEGFLERRIRTYDGRREFTWEDLGLLDQGVVLPYYGAAFNTVEVGKAVFWLGVTRDAKPIAQLPTMNEVQRLSLVGGPRLEREVREASSSGVTPLPAALPVSTREPLLHYLHITGEIAQIQRWYFGDSTTATSSAGQAGAAIAYLYRGAKDARESADFAIAQIIKHITKSPTLARNHHITDTLEVLELGTDRDRLNERLRDRFALTFSFRRYYKGKRVDRKLLERIAEMYRRLYFLRLSNGSLPRVELTAQTATGLLGAQLGDRLEGSVTFNEEHPALQERTIAAAMDIAQTLAEERWLRPPVMDYAKEYHDALERVALAGVAEKDIARRAAADGAAIAAALRGPCVPYVRARPATVWLLEDDTLQLTHFDDAVMMAVHPSVVRANILCDPAWQQPAEFKRFARDERIAAAFVAVRNLAETPQSAPWCDALVAIGAATADELPCLATFAASLAR